MDLKKIKDNIDFSTIFKLFITSLLIIFYITSKMRLPVWVQVGVLLLMAFLGGIDVGYQLTKV